jgi:hypothetical protein
VSRFNPRATQVLTPTDGGKLAAASGQKSSSSRNSCSTSCCTQCHFDIDPFLGITRVAFSADSFASLVRAEEEPENAWRQYDGHAGQSPPHTTRCATAVVPPRSMSRKVGSVMVRRERSDFPCSTGKNQDTALGVCPWTARFAPRPGHPAGVSKRRFTGSDPHWRGARSAAMKRAIPTGPALLPRRAGLYLTGGASLARRTFRWSWQKWGIDDSAAESFRTVIIP